MVLTGSSDPRGRPAALHRLQEKELRVLTLHGVLNPFSQEILFSFQVREIQGHFESGSSSRGLVQLGMELADDCMKQVVSIQFTGGMEFFGGREASFWAFDVPEGDSAVKR